MVESDGIMLTHQEFFVVPFNILPNKRSDFKKKVSRFTEFYQKKIDDAVLDYGARASLTDRKTQETINGLRGLSERIPLFDHVTSRSKYKDLDLFQIFVKIFRTEPLSR